MIGSALRSLLHRHFFALALSALLVTSTGCGTTADPARTGKPTIDLKSSDPVTVQMACLRARQAKDMDAIPALIENLGHESSAIRLHSHTALRELLSLGARPDPFGYSWALDENTRNVAVRAWGDWYEAGADRDLLRVRLARLTDDISAIPNLIELLRHEEAETRQRSYATLRRLVRLDEGEPDPHGYRPDLSPTEREKSVQAWEAWYSNEGKALVEEELRLRALEARS